MALNDTPDSSSITYTLLPEFKLWDKTLNNRGIISFNLEVMARCNNNCHHCYINLPAGDRPAIEQELTKVEINRIADEAIEMGALWCLLTGGEPLLRKDFIEIYMSLKRKGLLVTVFTNATLITKDIVELFKKYPPRSLEVTVYGVTKETYEKVTQKKGSFDAFMKGLNLLIDNGVPVDLKAMALKSNYHEMASIAKFCRERSKAKYRFDPMLILRYDRDLEKNRGIICERLTPEEVASLETNDFERFGEMQKKCDKLISPESSLVKDDFMFDCSTGKGDFTITYDGKLKLCSSLCHPDFVEDIRTGETTLKEAHDKLILHVISMRSNNPEFIERCCSCQLVNLCMCCPAHAWLESGQLDKPIDYFCDVAHARAAALSKALKK